MPVCQLCSKRCRVARFDNRLLEGDTFYDYFCPDCSNTKEGTFERHPLSWQTVIHLVLYHLQRQQQQQHRHKQVVSYFRWKEDICGFIERHWDDLIPQKNPGVSWQNSVSSVLSAHHDVFANGLEVKGETGWWALRVCEPPRIKPAGAAGGTVGTGGTAGINGGTCGAPVKKLKREVSGEDEPDTDDVEIKSEAGSIELMLEGEPGDDCKPTDNTNTSSGSSEQIKKQLLSRLLSVDSTLLKQALSKVKEEQLLQQQQELLKPKHSDSRGKSASTRAPPVENELLRILSRVKNPDCKMRRLRRKLISRRERRRAGIEMFDLDAFIYNYLKDPKPLDEHGSKIEPETVVSDGPTQQLQISTPYQSNKYLSIRYKLLGMSSFTPSFPTEFTSPFSGRPLPAYIKRDTDCFARSARGQLMHSLNRLFNQQQQQQEHPTTIDFIHLRREHVPQLNRLLSAFFWPNIDVAESADYPDYSIVAVYNRWLIVGAALLDPDGYLSHLFVRPDWSSSGIGTRLLHSLLQSAPPRDITLHCSATNPAMLLYNRFGFKPEQYIVNHYDKHYCMAEQSEECRALSTVLPFSKHAFLMRLRR